MAAKKLSKGWVKLLLRVVAFAATLTATLIMGLNKETKNIVVATIGSNSVKVSLTAKFQHTPAFVFFVIANAMASFHSLLMIVVEFLGPKLDYKGFRIVLITILDMTAAVLLSAGASGALFMGELGRNGNSHARWNKICDKFEKFCDHGSWAFIASSIGLLLFIIISTISIIKLRSPTKSSTLL